MERDDDDDIEGQLNPFNNVPSAAGGPVSLPLLPPPEEQQRVLHDAGYRDGASAGHALGLQEGFDEGFGEGIKAGEALGRLLGAASALQALGDRQPSGLPLATEKEREGVKREAMAVACALTERARHPEVLEEGGEGGEGGVEAVGKTEKEQVRRLLAGILGEEEGRRLVEG